jgi:hypothetical protein
MPRPGGRSPCRSGPPPRHRARNGSAESSLALLLSETIEVAGECLLDEARQRPSLVDGGMLYASNQLRWQIDVELLLLSRGHYSMLAA